MNNSTKTINETKLDFVPDGFKSTPEKIALFVVLIVLDSTTIFGNLLVFLSFYRVPKLRSHAFNYYIFNLAITDFLVAVTAMTFYTIYTLFGYWPFGVFMCGVWIFFDFAMTFASVFTVVAISLDRLWSVTWAQHYRAHNTTKKTTMILAIVWICVFLIWTPPFVKDRLRQSDPYRCIWEPSENRDFVLIVAVIGHYLPCAIIIGCYIKLLWVMRTRKKISDANNEPFHWRTRATMNIQAISMKNLNPMNNPIAALSRNDLASSQMTSVSQLDRSSSSTMKRERRTFITLTYILGGYLICWFPFYITFDIYAWEPDIVYEKLYIFLFWMTYLNSTINPMLYAFGNKDFKMAFQKVLGCRT